MTTNVTYEYANAKEKYDNAKTPEEKMLALQEMQRTAPAHKGGEKLRKEISKKMLALKKQMIKNREQQKKAGSSSSGMNVKKDGIGQVILAGFANTGKSTLLNKLAKTDVEVAPYPFTTTKPEVGMAPYKGAGLQVVDLPALMKGSSEGKASGTQLLSIIRNSDEVVFVLKGSNALREFKTLMKEVENVNMKFNQERPKIKIERSNFKGVTISGKQFLKVKEDALIGFLKSIGFHHASVVLSEDTTLEKVAQSMNDTLVYKKGFFIINTFFGVPSPRDIQKIKKVADVIEVNSLDEEEIEKIKDMMFERLNKILIYTKKPGGKVEMEHPLILDIGSKVEDVPEHLHKDFAKNLKFVKVWGSAKYDGQRVSKDYELKNLDIIEIYS
ncbi:MAG: GTPase [Candidatus Diapherotrites archaeon]